jgi:hypothetical protein
MWYDEWGCFVCRGGKGLRGGGAEAEAAGAAGYDGDFAFEGEEGWEIVELCFGHGDGLGRMYSDM